MTCQILKNYQWVSLHNGKALLSGFEFEKQKYMTIDEIKAKAEVLLKNSRESQGEFVQMYNNGFEDGVNFVLQNLNKPVVIGQFCDCIKDESDGADVNGDCVHCGRKHK